MARLHKVEPWSEAHWDMIHQYALMMRRDADFRLAVNRELARLYRSGDILNLYARWYGPLGEPSTLLKAMYFLNALPE